MLTNGRYESHETQTLRVMVLTDDWYNEYHNDTFFGRVNENFPIKNNHRITNYLRLATIRFTRRNQAKEFDQWKRRRIYKNPHNKNSKILDLKKLLGGRKKSGTEMGPEVGTMGELGSKGVTGRPHAYI